MATALDRIRSLRTAIDDVLDTMDLNMNVEECDHCGLIKKLSLDDFNAQKELAAMREKTTRYIDKIEAGEWHGRDKVGNFDPETAGTVRRGRRWRG